jgi:hypothetical protein
MQSLHRRLSRRPTLRRNGSDTNANPYRRLDDESPDGLFGEEGCPGNSALLTA